jgi:hypothetical protein
MWEQRGAKSPSEDYIPYFAKQQSRVIYAQDIWVLQGISFHMDT